ncbi:hypothetical protein QR680_011582 [Steinernema hermaphroditum]|uniref:Uncharacterized protein n=1 Tax=Steinernema hermaphroditum TaxID=289476 RepID=A0AA39I1E8_9BILA|nr:hypothetical protein QR680_011582 [Steinernema hermaphroditum]
MNTVPIPFVEAVQRLLRNSPLGVFFFRELSGVYHSVANDYANTSINLVMSLYREDDSSPVKYHLSIKGKIGGFPIGKSHPGDKEDLLAQNVVLPSLWLRSLTHFLNLNVVLGQESKSENDIQELLKFQRYFNKLDIEYYDSFPADFKKGENEVQLPEKAIACFPHFPEVHCRGELGQLPAPITDFLCKRGIISSTLDMRFLEKMSIHVEDSVLTKVDTPNHLLYNEEQFLNAFESIVSNHRPIKTISIFDCPQDYQMSILMARLHRIWIATGNREQLEFSGSFLMAHWKLKEGGYDLIKTESSVVATNDRYSDHIITWEEGSVNDTNSVLFQFLF